MKLTVNTPPPPTYALELTSQEASEILSALNKFTVESVSPAVSNVFYGLVDAGVKFDPATDARALANLISRCGGKKK